ncbi:MAG: acetyl-CoA C-acyltransferase [Chloroflexi bacterium]|nr:acetyl-CoA C-acyltransferase [Chloroflexota bacterium]|tara:strand:- start:6792 stop:7979 length:1188 start_codon:yes stop_codon:yes gene_type:complete
MTKDKKVVILSAKRTPIGKFLGAFGSLSAPHLASFAIKSAIKESLINKSELDYAIMGNVLSAGVGQAPARQALIYSGVSSSISAITVNKVCASGLMSVILGSQMIKSGDVNVVLSGGMENMSRAPHIMNDSRTDGKLGNKILEDSMIKDGLWCVFNDLSMGVLAEKTADKFGVTRIDQDNYAVTSHQRAISAINSGMFSSEIAPVIIENKKGKKEFIYDEGPRDDTTLEVLENLKSPFSKNGVATAGNSSQISDGAAAVILSDSDYATSKGLNPIAIIDNYAIVANDPAELFEAPAIAVEKVLVKSNTKIEEIDLFEVNEAFAGQILSNAKYLNLDWSKVNVNGGAIALGHPLGATGTRILVTLIHALKNKDLKTGIAVLCHGGGGAVAIKVSLL